MFNSAWHHAVIKACEVQVSVENIQTKASGLKHNWYKDYSKSMSAYLFEAVLTT